MGETGSQSLHLRSDIRNFPEIYRLCSDENPVAANQCAICRDSRNYPKVVFCKTVPLEDGKSSVMS
jgi:hypothetical protein